MIKLLVVGQTPPPFGGQAMMIQNMLNGHYTNVKLYHIRMNFSSEMDEIGKFKIKKLFHVLSLIIQIYFYKIRFQISFLYYVPGGPNLVPVYRDMLLLLPTRWLFKKCIFHFHAGSTYSMYEKIPCQLRWCFKNTYFYPEIGIRITRFNPDDPALLGAKKEFIVENGIEDLFDSNHPKNSTDCARIIFIGKICHEKGIMDLLQACDLLNKKIENFRVVIVGKFESEYYKEVISQYIKRCKLENKIEFLGVLTGNTKLEQLYMGDIFCLPSHFETFGLVLLEAMQFSLPVVATNTGGIPALIEHGENGYLVNQEDCIDLSEKLFLLIKDKSLRIKMGTVGRAKYLNNFTQEKFYRKMDKVFLSLISNSR